MSYIVISEYYVIIGSNVENVSIHDNYNSQRQHIFVTRKFCILHIIIYYLYF